MQNALTLLESRHTQELSEAKDEWHEKEKALIKQSESNKRTAERAEQQLENMEQWNFWQFRSWKKFQKLNKKTENKSLFFSFTFQFRNHLLCFVLALISHNHS